MSMVAHAPIMLREVQTDNGTEFTKCFISSVPNDKSLFERSLANCGIIHPLLRRHNSKVEINEMRFHRHTKMYSVRSPHQALICIWGIM